MPSWRGSHRCSARCRWRRWCAEVYRFDADEHSQTLAIALVRERITARSGGRRARRSAWSAAPATSRPAAAPRRSTAAPTGSPRSPPPRPPAGRRRSTTRSTAGVAIMVDLYELAGRLRRGPRDAAATADRDPGARRARRADRARPGRQGGRVPVDARARRRRLRAPRGAQPGAHLSGHGGAARVGGRPSWCTSARCATRSARPPRPPRPFPAPSRRRPTAPAPAGPRAGRDAAPDRRDPGRARRPDRPEDGEGLRAVADEPADRPPAPRGAQHAEPAAVAPHGVHRPARHRQDDRRTAGGRDLRVARPAGEGPPGRGHPVRPGGGVRRARRRRAPRP